MEGATVSVTNLAPPLFSPSTDGLGSYAIGNVPAFTTLDVSTVYADPDSPVFVPPSLATTRSRYSVGEGPTETLDLDAVRFTWLAQTAFECGIFASVQDATGESTGSINPYWLQRSTLVGTLKDEAGSPRSGIQKEDITVWLGGFANSDGNPADSDAYPATLCFLDDPGDGRLIGTSSTTSTSTGAFVMFRLRDDVFGVGFGEAEIDVAGFAPSTLNLITSGNIGVADVWEDPNAPVDAGAPIDVDFETDVYPIFTNYGCVGCHSAGGVGDVDLGGYPADFSGAPEEAYDNLVGPGAD